MKVRVQRAAGEFAERISLVSELGGISRCTGCRHLGFMLLRCARVIGCFGCSDAGTNSFVDTLAFNNCYEEGLRLYAGCMSPVVGARSGG